MQDQDRIYRGTRIPKAHQEFVDVLGVEAAVKLCRYFGGEEKYIPTADGLDRAVRDERIRELHAKGIHPSRIAERFGVSRQTVHNILKKGKNSTGNAD